MFDKATLDVIKDYMLSKENTIAVAESVTSGLIQSAFASIEDASRFSGRYYSL
jgi:nicotinamide-nucleotide amidase